MDTRHAITALGRDPDAFEAFYREHLEAVQRFVARRVSSPQDAADLTADVFVAVIDASARYRGDGAAPLAWVYGIARNVVAGHLRSQSRHHRAAERVRQFVVVDDDAVDRLVERLDGQQAGRRLMAEVQGLPAGQRAVVELVAVDGLSLTEAAAALGIRAGAARVRYHRARTKLAHALPDPPDADGTPRSPDATPTTPDTHEVRP